MNSSFKLDLFEKLLSKDLSSLSPTECEKETFSYLDSIANYKGLNQLIEYSEKLNEIKSKMYFISDHLDSSNLSIKKNSFL